MSVYKQALAGIPGGRVLDVATGRGGFVGTLKICLESYADMVAIDVSERALKDARSTYGEEAVRFIRMDAERLACRDECFDTVSAAKSLHHWSDVPKVLGEMMRVLKPGGHLVVSDMHRDVQTEPQRTDMRIHHLGAELHRYLGFTHSKTSTRQQIADVVGNLGLSNIATYDWTDTDSDPMDAEALSEKEELIDRMLHDARGMPNYRAFERRGEELRQRLHDLGIQSEPVLVIVGRK